METTRDRFNKVMHWQKPERVPFMDFGYWDETIQLWHQQGLPENITTGAEVEVHLGLEGTERIPTLPVINGLHPAAEPKVLEEKGSHRIIQDHEGNICEIPTEGASIPKYIKYAIETREDWEAFKARHLDYLRPDRIGDCKQVVEDAHAAGMPVRLISGSLYGWLRNWMGVENFSIAVLTDKAWVEEMMEHLTRMTLHLIENSLPGLDVDMAWWWEDMCYNHGPLMSPKLFQELMVSRYKRITDALRKYGVDVNVLDCDGCIYELVPGWIEGGINCMFPLESAHTDAVRLREEYGQDLLLFGAVDKTQLSKDRATIDRELERLRPLVEKGGFIPTVDHRVPPDVSYDNYLYYLEKKKEILSC
jgi:uroporphyrinogen decarboxylase